MKLKLIGVMMVIIMILSPFLFSQTFVKAPMRDVDGAVPGIIYNQNQATYPQWVAPIFFNIDSISVILSEVDTNARTLYNFQSNANPQQIQQNPSNSNNIHAIFMTAKDAAGSWNTRNMYDFYSSNGGTNWTFEGPVASVRAGYGYLALMNNGRSLVALHSTDGGTDLRAQIYVELSEGAGSFNRLEPGDFLSLGGSLQHIWPRCISTNNDQVVFWSSVKATNPADSVFRDRATSLTGTGTFTGYVYDPYAQASECYTLARLGSKVCCAFISSLHTTTHVPGSIMYFESTDNGVTWGSPVLVREASVSPGSDSLCGYRGTDVVYYNNQPAILFTLSPQDPYGQTFYPAGNASIYFWTQAVGLVRLDSLPGTTCNNYTVNDGLICVGRPSLGVSSDGTTLYATWMHARSDSSYLGAPFFDIYFSYSTNGGSVWSSNIQLTNPPNTPLKDNRFPSISKWNLIGNAYIIYQQSDSAGSNINGGPTQWSKMYMAHITNPIGIRTIGTEIPKGYALSQNYPNPFNPSTMIRFALPQNDKVTLKVYDVTGKLVTILLSNQKVNAGIHEVEFNASTYASGIYFYTISTEKFTNTKKMILLK